MFDGNFHRDAALEILQCSFLSLATLIDKSLLRRISPERYELHELLRQFAKEKLPPVVVEQGWEPLGLVSRFVSYYLGRMGVKAADLKRNDVSARIQELREDYKNVHQAWRWMIQSGETNQITAYLDNFVDYHLTCSMPSEGIEAIRWATGYLGDHPARDQQRVEIMLDIAQARMLTVQWKRDAVLQLARRASEQATQIGETRFEMQALTLLGWALEGKGDYAQAMTCLQQALAYYRQQDDREMQARTLLRTGTIFWRLNQPQQARARYQEAHDLFKALNDPVGQASSLQGLGLVFAQQWQYTQALACYHQAYDLDRAAGQKAGMVALLGNMGSIYGRTSEYARAISLYQEALEIEEELGNLGRSGLWLSNMGEMYLQLDDLEKAGEHLERGIAALRADGDLQDLVRVLILQAELSLRLNDLEAVETTVAEAMQLATRLGAENFLFAGRVLRARLSAAHQDVAHALKQLSELLDADRSEEEQAELYFRMWELDRDEEKRQNAMVLYAALSERFPDMVYHQRLKAMENQPDAP
jgi:tetratricopeptide (TPR) repeat protein